MFYPYSVHHDSFGTLYPYCGITEGNLVSPLSPFGGDDVFITKYGYYTYWYCN